MQGWAENQHNPPDVSLTKWPFIRTVVVTAELHRLSVEDTDIQLRKLL